MVKYVVQNALQVVRPEDVYVVVGYRQQEVRDHLGPKFHYVEQEKPRGTGDAVLQVCETIPGIRRQPADPLRRHAAVSSGIDSGTAQSAPPEASTSDAADRGGRPAPLPYGRIIRDAGGQIIDIIEDTEASAEVRAIREVNVGAYVVDAKAIAAALQNTLAVAGRWRLPAHRLRAPVDPLGTEGGELPALRSGRSTGHQLRRRLRARGIHPARSACIVRGGRKSRT